MEQKLDFSLPKKEEKKSCTGGLAVVLLIAAVAIGAANLYVVVKGRPAPGAAGTSISFEQAQDLAGKLASRSLYERAAEVLKAAVSQTRLGGADPAKAYFQIAGYLADAGRYDEAIEYYYRSEMFGKVADGQQMNARLQECFEKLGKFAALEREITARTTMGGEKQDSAVVAEIGTEKITAQKVDELIEQQIEDQMARYAAFMTSEQASQRKREMVKQYTEPGTRQKFLEAWLGQELLYRQAMEKGLADKPEAKRAMQAMVKAMAAEQAMNEEVASKVSITETDVKTYYEAHKSEYMEQTKDANSPPRQKGLDEVKDSVFQQLRSEKTRDVQQAYIKSLMDKFNVVVYTSALGGSSKEESQGKVK